jgi:hypothetical protein
MKFLRVVLIAALCFCTNLVAQSQQADNKLIEIIQSQQIVLSGGSAWDFGGKRRTLKALHDSSLWGALAVEVIRTKYDSDLAYYYLARSAEGLGQNEAAKKYYFMALNSKKCDTLINNCNGFSFPKDINARLDIIKEKPATSAIASAPTSTSSLRTISVSLPAQWTTVPTTVDMLVKGVFHFAKHDSLGAITYFSREKYDPAISLLNAIDLRLKREAATLTDVQIVPGVEITLNGRNWVRGGLIGKAKNSDKKLYVQFAFEKINDELVMSAVLIPEHGFLAFRDYIEKIPSFVKTDSNPSPHVMVEAARPNTRESDVSTEVADGERRPGPPTAQAETAATAPVSSTRRALIIGNDGYRNVSRLVNAREDARTMAESLAAVGYQVTLKLDLNEKEMKASLRAFSSQVQGGDEVVFFFAGHGVQLGAANFLLPTDILGESEAQVKDEAIQLQRVLDDMSERRAKFTLAIVDACRDNPFKSSGRAIGGRGLAPTSAATGQMVIFSAGIGQQALDRLGNSDRSKNGLFTRIFIQEIQKTNHSIDRIVKSVRNQVAELARTVGHEQVPAIYDQVLGDFYFRK